MREDRAKKENEEAKNGLEGWVIDTRARINDEEELERVSTETWREKFKETLEEAEDWLYEGGEGGGANANKTQFTAKKENEEAKNGLEGWVIDTRARINDEKELERVSTETWREKFKETLEAAEDWLYEGG